MLMEVRRACVPYARNRNFLFRGKSLLVSATFFASLGMFLFGFDQGVLSNIIIGKFFNTYFKQPSSFEIATIVAILEIGALVSTVFLTFFGDSVGRRTYMLNGALLLLLGGILQTFSVGIKSIILGRLVSGMGVGIMSTIAPVFQSEISPPRNRGFLACIEFSLNILGYGTSVWIGYFASFLANDLQWRLPLFFQVLISMILFLGVCAICESPRYLISVGRDDEGLLVLKELVGASNSAENAAHHQFEEIKSEIKSSKLLESGPSTRMLRTYKRSIFIAVSALLFAQLNGINVICYYAPLVFQEAGWVGRGALLMTGLNAIVYFLSTVPPWYLVDRWGRRKILISGGLMMGISMFMIGLTMFLKFSLTPQLVLIFVVLFNAFHGYSWGPIPWLLPPEVFPLSMRSAGTSLSSAVNWISNFVVGEFAPILQEKIGSGLYILHGTSCILSILVVWLTYPETKGIPLEDMGQVLSQGSSGKYWKLQQLANDSMFELEDTIRGGYSWKEELNVPNKNS